jgi:hypothetical protein
MSDPFTDTVLCQVHDHGILIPWCPWKTKRSTYAFYLTTLICAKKKILFKAITAKYFKWIQN